MSDRSPLRQALDTAIGSAAMADIKMSMKDLTVLAVQNDPFRIDTEAGHRDGEWLAITCDRLGLSNRTIHLRGIHYAVIGEAKPNGQPYANTDQDWNWLQEKAADAARWLGYIPFDRIVDQRNDAPTVQEFEQPDPFPYLTVGLNIELPAADEILPKLGVADFEGVQPFRIVLVGEKSSLKPVLGPIANNYQADLYLPTGCLSDTMIHRMASVVADDGRPMVVLYFSDCDPSGWNMPIEVARKLQALKAGFFPELQFQVHAVALTPDQVREHELPSTPLKDTERRAGKWQAAMGVEQTEIDALASLRPDLLRDLARNAILPFYDTELDRRVTAARQEWMTAALEVINDNLDGERLSRIHAQAERVLSEMRQKIAELSEDEAFRISVHDFDLPQIVVPEADVGPVYPLPLLHSDWPFTDQCKALIDSKAYRNGDGSDG